jgi:hypothetical protein
LSTLLLRLVLEHCRTTNTGELKTPHCETIFGLPCSFPSFSCLSQNRSNRAFDHFGTPALKGSSKRLRERLEQILQ